MTAMVCKHCGGDDFFINVTVSGWQDISTVTTDEKGRPDFCREGSVEVDTYDSDIESFACNGCKAESRRAEGLMVAKPAAGERAIAACGRCDHGRAQHGEFQSTHKHHLGYTRAAMPCEHDDCDCHDYYDREFAETPVAA